MDNQKRIAEVDQRSLPKCLGNLQTVAKEFPALNAMCRAGRDFGMLQEKHFSDTLIFANLLIPIQNKNRCADKARVCCPHNGKLNK